MPRPKKPASPFRYFNSSPEIIRLVVMMYLRFPPHNRSFSRFAHFTKSRLSANPDFQIKVD